MTEPGAGIVCIVNPTSGGGAGRNMADKMRAVLEDAGIRHSVHVTERPGHASDLARQAVEAGARVVAAVGGDGTIHETANGLIRALLENPSAPTALGLVPVGTGNDFVKVVPGTAKKRDAVRTLVHGAVRRFDAGLATWNGGSEYFVNAAGTGIDVDVVRVMGPHHGGAGASAYVSALVRSLRRYRAIPVSITADGVGTEARVMMIAIANGRSIGGTFRICPDAEPDDGLLDLCIVRDLTIGRSILAAARIVLGTHANHPAVRMTRTRKLHLTVAEDTPLFFQLDGELREPEGARTLEIEVCAGILPVVCDAPRA